MPSSNGPIHDNVGGSATLKEGKSVRIWKTVEQVREGQISEYVVLKHPSPSVTLYSSVVVG